MTSTATGDSARPPPRRFMVLGCAGSGKTTFARRLAERMGISFICLDQVWRPGWGPEEMPQFRKLVAEAHAADAWVSDGNFALATFDLRMPRADLVIWLDRPRVLCAARALTRTLKPDEAHRPGDLDKVLRYIWGFDRLARPRIEIARLAHGPHVPVVHLTSDKDTDAFVRRWPVGELIAALARLPTPPRDIEVRDDDELPEPPGL